MAKTLEVPFCPQCKEKRDGKFCYRCGTELVEAVVHCPRCDYDNIWPHEKFLAVARSGMTNMSTDQSGSPRYVPMLFAVGDKVVPSLALATVAAALTADPVLGNDYLQPVFIKAYPNPSAGL